MDRQGQEGLTRERLARELRGFKVKKIQRRIEREKPIRGYSIERFGKKSSNATHKMRNTLYRPQTTCDAVTKNLQSKCLSAFAGEFTFGTTCALSQVLRQEKKPAEQVLISVLSERHRSQVKYPHIGQMKKRIPMKTNSTKRQKYPYCTLQNFMNTKTQNDGRRLADDAEIRIANEIVVPDCAVFFKLERRKEGIYCRLLSRFNQCPVSPSKMKAQNWEQAKVDAEAMLTGMRDMGKIFLNMFGRRR